MTGVAFMGVGFTPIERTPGRSALGYALDAALDAIADAGLTRDDIDGYVGSAAPPTAGAAHVDGADEVSMYLLTQRLGLSGLGWLGDVQGMPVAMVAAAATAVRSGACRYVLGMRVMYRLPDRRYGASGGGAALGEDQYQLPYGAGPGGTRFATAARRYLELSGATRADLYPVVANARRWAAMNPVAVWRDRPVSRDDYLGARMVADPLGLYDCDLPVCGAGAFVLATAEAAAHGPHPPAHLRSWSNWTQPPDTVFGQSGIDRERIDLAQLYDGYSSFVYPALERFGWCKPHEAWRFAADGGIGPGGELPVNTFGGNLGEGRLHGIGHVREAVLQVTGRAGERQVPGARDCLVHVGPPDLSWTMVVSADAR